MVLGPEVFHQVPLSLRGLEKVKDGAVKPEERIVLGGVWLVRVRRDRFKKGTVDGEFGSAKGVHRIYYASCRVIMLRFRHAPRGFHPHRKPE